MNGDGFTVVVITWVQQAYIKASNNNASDYFSRVDLSSDTLDVGVYSEDSNQTTITNGTTSSSDNSNANSGAVYVYQRTGATWIQEAYMKAANNDASDGFGFYVDLSSDPLAVGAGYEASNQTSITNGTSASTDNTSSNSGAVYIYTR